MLGYHINMGLEDGRVIAPTTATQRTLARTVLASGGDYKLMAWRAADTHLHLSAACSRRRAGSWVRNLSTALRCRLGLPTRFTPAHFEPIVDQRHLYNVFRYVLRQDERHGIQLDPFAEASNIPDLLGMRSLGRYTGATVAQLLPRIRADELVARLGLTLPQLLEGPISDGARQQLSDAAAATVALPDLRQRLPESVAARRAAVAFVGDELTSQQLGALLDITARSVRRLRGQPADPRLMEAIARQLRLRTALAGSTAVPGQGREPKFTPGK
ncbi:MAG: hypothetical protein DRI90_02770 [Deltaproteobacteria bacterium]|nr:MAG: hypothetical protein DRI90_02770 [Deltaproteobacteria bacterium]